MRGILFDDANPVDKRTTFRKNVGIVEDVVRHARSRARLNSRVPVAMGWTENGQVKSGLGSTVDVGTRGCLIVVPQEFGVGQRLELTNLVTNQVCSAVIMWRGHQLRTGWEFGLELQNPPEDFWSIQF